MTKTWYARTASSLLVNGCIGLILFCAGMGGMPSWADKAQTDRAVAIYLNTTLPAIAKMKPFIDKPAAARAKAIPAMGVGQDPCGSALDSIYSHQRLAEGAIGVCLAMFKWMRNDEIQTCVRANYAHMDLFATSNADMPDPAILKRHKSDDVEAIRQRTEKAAGCARKDIGYWGRQVFVLDDLLAGSVSPTGELVASGPGIAPLTPDEFEIRLSNCHSARTLTGANLSNAVEAANDSCYSTYHLLSKDTPQACESLASGLDRLANSRTDPLGKETPALKARLSARFDALGCAPIIAASKLATAEKAKAEAAKLAAEKVRVAAATPAPSTSASAPSASSAYVEKANSLVGMINFQTKLYTSLSAEASQLYDRGDTGAACEKFQLALTTLRSLAGTYWELGTHTGDQSRFVEEARLRTRAIELRDDDYPGGVCRKFGSGLR